MFRNKIRGVKRIIIQVSDVLYPDLSLKFTEVIPMTMKVARYLMSGVRMFVALLTTAIIGGMHSINRAR